MLRKIHFQLSTLAALLIFVGKPQQGFTMNPREEERMLNSIVQAAQLPLHLEEGAAKPLAKKTKKKKWWKRLGPYFHFKNSGKTHITLSCFKRRKSSINYREGSLQIEQISDLQRKSIYAQNSEETSPQNTPRAEKKTYTISQASHYPAPEKIIPLNATPIYASQTGATSHEWFSRPLTERLSHERATFSHFQSEPRRRRCIILTRGENLSIGQQSASASPDVKPLLFAEAFAETKGLMHKPSSSVSLQLAVQVDQQDGGSNHTTGEESEPIYQTPPPPYNTD
jgi:hypothetical protein